MPINAGGWPRGQPGRRDSTQNAAVTNLGAQCLQQNALCGLSRLQSKKQLNTWNETDSISRGLDYPGVSPIHCFLKDSGRARYTFATDEDALNAYKLVTKLETISPSLEPSHAFAEAIKIAPKLSKDTIIICNSCGDSYKDRDIIKKRLGRYIKWFHLL